MTSPYLTLPLSEEECREVRLSAAKILGCPWCGSEPEIKPLRFSDMFYAVCSNEECPVESQATDFTRALVIKRWNTRAQVQPQRIAESQAKADVDATPSENTVRRPKGKLEAQADSPDGAELVSRLGARRSASATSEIMDVTGGESAAPLKITEAAE